MDKCAQCRKFQVKLFLKGERCTSAKCALTRRNYRPGAHGQKTNVRKSEYGLQLLEKQKAKAEYGLRERQFSKVYKRASRSRENTGEELLRLLEQRIDNVVYRIGWAASRKAARQLVSHRKIKLNDKVVNVASIVLQKADRIAPNRKEALKPLKVNLPKWVKYDPKAMSAEIIRLPNREEIETDLDEQKILEFYSR